MTSPKILSNTRDQPLTNHTKERLIDKAKSNTKTPTQLSFLMICVREFKNSDRETNFMTSTTDRILSRLDTSGNIWTRLQMKRTGQ